MTSKPVFAAQDEIFSRLLRDAHVGSSRVRPAEVTALLDRLEGWIESSSPRMAHR